METPLLCLLQIMVVEEITELLLENRANPNIKNKNGANALMSVLKNKNYEILKLLLEKGADPDTADRDGLTALMFVANYNLTNLLNYY